MDAWTVTSNASFLHVAAGSASGAGNAIVVFTYDSFTGTGSRSGTLTVAGFTVTVTQAGPNYLPPGPVLTLESQLISPAGTALDSAGNVYLTNVTAGTVQEWNAATQQLTTPVAAGLNQPNGLAVDASGNIYIADTGDNEIQEFSPTTQQLTALISSGLNGPSGVAVDSDGNVYIADDYNKTVEEWNAATEQLIPIVSGLGQPNSVAVDNSGNVFFTDNVLQDVEEWNASTQQVVVLVPGLNNPSGVAVDGSGNVYFSDSGNQAIKEWVAATQQVITVASSGLASPAGVSVDASGNVYFADSGNFALKDLPNTYVGPPSLTEPAQAGSDSLLPVLPSTAPLTGVFAPTSDQSWLSIGSITNGFIDFSFAANTSTTTLTAHITVLGQTITVTQNGLTSQTISFGALPNQVYGSAPFMVSATASSGLTVTFVSATPSVCSVSGAIVTLIQAGTCTIQATQAGDTDFAPAPTVTQGFQVTQATPTVAFTGAPASAPFRSTFTVVAATNASTTAVISVSGPCSISGTTVTITAGSGTCVLTATWAADNNYTAGSATQSTVATKATPTISWPTPAPITYGTPLTAAQLDATATYNKTPVPGSFAYTPPAGTVLMAGAETLSVKFTPKIAGYSDATGSVTLQVNQARPKTIWPKPAAIPYGTASKQHATGRLIPGGRSFRLFAARWNRAARRDPHAFGRIFAD